jgi:type I restriction enzyme, S subunit
MSALANSWTRVRFGDMAASMTERVDDPSAAGVDRYVGLEHLDPASLRITRWGLPTDVEATKLRFKAGDVIFGRRRAYQRKVAVADFDGICSAHALVLRAKPEVALPEFLPLFMQSDLFFNRALAISVGSLSPTINWGLLAKQEFELPPLPEQKRLADLLWSMEDLWLRWRATEDALQGLARVLEQRAFEVAREKNMVPCRDICDLAVGIVVRPASYYVAEGIPAIRSLNVLPNRLDLSELVYISAESNRLLSKSRLHIGDVVVVRSGRPGDAAAITSELEGANCIDLIIVRPGRAIHPEYLCRYLNSGVGRARTHAQSAGTAQQHFNVGALAALLVPVPTMIEQERIVQELSAVEQRARAIDEHLESLRTVQKALRYRFLREQRV